MRSPLATGTRPGCFEGWRLQSRSPLGREARIVNMSELGKALNNLHDPPVKAMVVYNSNPAAVAPDRNAVLRGVGREDLFTVVLEHFQTDTADWADIVLPATTQLEHWDIHFAYGHHYASLNQPAIAPVGESKRVSIRPPSPLEATRKIIPLMLVRLTG